MRKPEWKQKNPRDQLVVVLMAIEGIADNLFRKRYLKFQIPEKIQRIQYLTEDARYLAQLNPDSWDSSFPGIW